MLIVYENSRSTLKFHNVDAKFSRLYAENKNKFLNDTYGDNYIGEIFDGNIVFLKFYSGSYILRYEDKFGNVIDNILPIVHLLYDEGVEIGENSFNNDFGDNF